jgi:ethanolamine ammonia-lyase small subunit
MSPRSAIAEDPWRSLRSLTTARIAQGRSGGSLPTQPLLAFELARARARDAVHLPFAFAFAFDAQAMATLAPNGAELIHVHSAAPSRDIYLRRPDLGRRLDSASRARLEALPSAARQPDIVFVVADGLSALAAHRHALAVFTLASGALRAAGWQVAPLVVAEQARVALGDEIGELLGARQVAILIGERPGLSTADSLSIYLTYAPRPGRHDAERNCISNVHQDGGLGYAQAAHKLAWLAHEARKRQLTGVLLKDDSGTCLPDSNAHWQHEGFSKIAST